MKIHLQWQCTIFISSLLIFIHSITGQNFNYADLGSDVWNDTYPTCAGRLQSPINIRTACTIYDPFTPFDFSSAYDQTHSFTLTNNGHTIVGRYNGNDSSSLILTGGGLDGTYEFLNFHLHWGENYKSGSEHQVNGAKYAGEIHFVHTNPETSEFAVLGFFMQSNQDTNRRDMIRLRNRNSDIYETTNNTIDEWKKYFVVAQTLGVENSSNVVNLTLASLMGNNLDRFWRYKGSLTTPPCTEGVIWSVFKTPIVFNESKMIVFRKNLSLGGYREPQALYNRVVYRNFPEQILSSIPDYQCCSKGSNTLANQFLFFVIVFCTVSY